jgi:hypothetical protein
MRVFDCIVFTDELGALRDRMRALQDIPEVTHVICEAPVDYQGESKGLYFWENRNGFYAKWHGRWNHVRVEPHEISGNTPEERERSLRGYLPHGFHGDPENDVILYGDLREIPDPAYIRELAGGKP